MYHIRSLSFCAYFRMKNSDRHWSRIILSTNRNYTTLLNSLASAWRKMRKWSNKVLRCEKCVLLNGMFPVLPLRIIIQNHDSTGSTEILNLGTRTPDLFYYYACVPYWFHRAEFQPNEQSNNQSHRAPQHLMPAQKRAAGFSTPKTPDDSFYTNSSTGFFEPNPPPSPDRHIHTNTQTNPISCVYHTRLPAHTIPKDY